MEIELVGSVEIAKIQAIFEPLDYTFLVIEKGKVRPMPPST